MLWQLQAKAADQQSNTDIALVALEVMNYTSQAISNLDKERIALERLVKELNKRAEALRAYERPAVG